MTPIRVLIVCSGNTCRSPMAAGILREFARNRGRAVEVQTAGLEPLEGEPIAKNAVRAMREIGIDISADYPKGVTPELVAWADVVIPLDDRYRDELADRCPAVSSKARTLTRGILDPFGRPLNEYRQCRDALREEIHRIAPDILADPT